jgi:hypothetical protein
LFWVGLHIEVLSVCSIRLGGCYNLPELCWNARHARDDNQAAGSRPGDQPETVGDGECERLLSHLLI